jgi:N-dimethylarginine dimethylaminohydrolase
MNIQDNSDKDKAIQQWILLESKIKELGGTVHLIDPKPGLPDMVFTANAGLFFGNTAIVSRFKHKERQGEEKFFDEWFRDRYDSYQLHENEAEQPFEGAGDALYFRDTLIVGHGFRSSLESYAYFSEYIKDLLVVTLVDPYFYHLDTCFCPLNDGDYLIYTNAFDGYSLNNIRARGTLEIAIPEEEAKMFACNAVVIGNNVILPTGCPKTVSTLRERGYEPHELDMSEFLKSGGACKCLTLRLP